MENLNYEGKTMCVISLKEKRKYHLFFGKWIIGHPLLLVEIRLRVLSGSPQALTS